MAALRLQAYWRANPSYCFIHKSPISAQNPPFRHFFAILCQFHPFLTIPNVSRLLNMTAVAGIRLRGF